MFWPLLQTFKISYKINPDKNTRLRFELSQDRARLQCMLLAVLNYTKAKRPMFCGILLRQPTKRFQDPSLRIELIWTLSPRNGICLNGVGVMYYAIYNLIIWEYSEDNHCVETCSSESAYTKNCFVCNISCSCTTGCYNTG